LNVKIFKNKRPKSKEMPEFNKAIWLNFVEFIFKCRHGKASADARNIWPNRIPIKYHYLDIEYNYLIFKFVIKNEKTIGIEFWVPEDPRSTLSCRLINRVSTIEEAISYVTELTENHFSI